MLRLKSRTSLFVLCLATGISVFSGFAQTPPMNLETLKKVMAVGEEVVPTSEILTRVKQEGVDFFLDADMKTELILSAAEGGRSESNTLKVIDALADACVPCKERWEGPISTELALKFLGEQVRTKDILKEIQKRGLAKESLSAEEVETLRKAGASEAMLVVMSPAAAPIPPVGFAPLQLAKSKDFDEKRAYGSADIRLRVDDRAEFVVAGSNLYFKTLSGKDPVAQNSTISGALPRLPASAFTFSLQQKSGRSKVTDAATGATDAFGFSSVTFSVNDEKSGEANYQLTLSWQLKPYTLEELKKDVEELSGSYPDLLADWIRRRGFGVSYTPEIEQALQSAGASAQLISTVRGSIRMANNPPR
jgi:hypothetical protein